MFLSLLGLSKEGSTDLHFKTSDKHLNANIPFPRPLIAICWMEQPETLATLDNCGDVVLFVKDQDRFTFSPEISLSTQLQESGREDGFLTSLGCYVAFSIGSYGEIWSITNNSRGGCTFNGLPIQTHTISSYAHGQLRQSKS